MAEAPADLRPGPCPGRRSHETHSILDRMDMGARSCSDCRNKYCFKYEYLVSDSAIVVSRLCGTRFNAVMLMLTCHDLVRQSTALARDGSESHVSAGVVVI